MEGSKSHWHILLKTRFFFVDLENYVYFNTFGEAVRAVREDAVDDGQDMCERVAWCL